MQQAGRSLIEFFIKNEFNDHSQNGLRQLVESGIKIDDQTRGEKCTPLFFCVIERKLCWIPLLLKYGADPSMAFSRNGAERLVTASDIAWQNRDYDCVVQLIRAGGPFPSKIDETKLNSDQMTDIGTIFLAVRRLHRQIQKNNMDSVLKILEKHPEMKYGYRVDNQSALSTALESKSFEIYAVLCSRGFATGINSDFHNQLLEGLVVSEKIDFEIKLRQTFKTTSRYVLDLISKSKIHSEQQYYGIKESLEYLDEIDDMKVILQFVASSDTTFDFDLDLNYINNCSSSTKEKHKSESNLVRVFVYEFTQMTLNLLYNNKCLPYHANDVEKALEFKKIVEKFQEDDRIRIFFQNENCDSEKIATKLIAEVLQIIVLKKNHPDRFADLKATFKDLIDFYENNVLPDLKNSTTIMELIKTTPFSEKSEKRFQKLLEYGADVNQIENSEIGSPLYYCVREKKFSWIPLLLKFGADPSQTECRIDDSLNGSACDVAWINEDYDVVYQLIMADGPYPKNFDLRKLSRLQKHDIANRLVMVRFFHAQINKNRIKAVKKFARKHSTFKYAYNLQNNCALSIAVASKNPSKDPKIYLFLRSKGFSVGLYGKKSIGHKITKYFTYPQVFIEDLVAKSCLGPNNDQNRFKDVKNYFRMLSAIVEMKVVLELVASSNDVKIIFDFNDDSVCGIDPANPGKASVGRTYGSNEKILIAAKRQNELELLGTLAHEMTHYALYLIYNNNYLPYFPNNTEIEEKFKKVVADCYQLKDKNETIGSVYKNNNYNSSEIPMELIARVPQLMVLHKNDTEILEKLRDTFKELFIFFEWEVLPDLKKEAAMAAPKSKFQNFNKVFGLFDLIVSRKLLCDGQQEKLRKVIEESEWTFVQTETPELALTSLATKMLKNSTRDHVSSKNILAEIKQLEGRNFSEFISFITNTELKSTVFILDVENDDLGKCKKIFDKLKNNTKIVFVTSNSHENYQEFFSKSFVISFYWSDLTKSSKNELLDHKIYFQDEEIRLKDILEECSEVLENLLVKDVLNVKKFNEGVFAKFEQTSTMSKVFIERKFVMNGRQLESKDRQAEMKADDVFEQLLKNQCVVLADSAGMGKTTSAIEFAKTLKKQLKNINVLCWVVFIDLKQHTSVFLRDDEPQLLNLKPSFFSNNILKLKKNFEGKVFEEFFRLSKIYFILDGIDEISPRYKKFVLNMTKSIKDTGNHLLVTTRTHLTMELENRLNNFSIKLKPFDETEQINFLRKFWKQSMPEASLDLLEAKAEKLLSIFQNALTERDKDFVGVPLQLYMMAEVFSDAEMKNDQVNLFSLYYQFVAKKLSIWNKKGPLAQDDNTELQLSDFNVRSIHQKIAIDNIFGQRFSESLNFPKFDENEYKERILRIGLIKVAINDLFEFVHKTFAEFLIADYCFVKLTANVTSSSEVDMFLRILQDQDFENIRKFINEKFKTETEKLKRGIMCHELATRLSQEENKGLVSQLMSEELINLVLLILHTDVSIFDRQAKFKLVEYTNKYCGSSLEVAVENLEFFSTLWQAIESFTDVTEQKELLLTEMGEKGNILDQTVTRKKYDVLSFVLQILIKITDAEDFKKCFIKQNVEKESFIVKAAKESDGRTLEIFWRAIEKKLEVKEQKALLYFNSDGVLVDLIKHSEGILRVLETIAIPLRYSEFISFLRGADWLVDVFDYFAYFAENEIFSVLWNFIENNFKNKEERKILLLTKFKEKNAIDCACKNKNFSTMQHVFSIASDLMTKEGFFAELTTADSKGFVAFHHALLGGNVKEFVALYEKTFDLELSKNEIKDLLKWNFPNNKNLTHLLSTYMKCETEYVWDFILTHLETAEIKDLITIKLNNEHNAFSFAAFYNDRFLIIILKWFKLNSDSDGVKKVFTERTKSMNLLHIVSHHCEENLAQNTIDFLINCQLDDSFIEIILLAHDKDGDTPLCLSLYNDNVSVVKVLWNFYEMTLSESKLKTLILDKNKNILQCRGSRKSASVNLLKSFVYEKFSDITDE